MQQPLTANLTTDVTPPVVESSALASSPPEVILALTRELFGPIVGIESSYDPEYPLHTWVTLIVEASGEHAPILARELEWARGMARLGPQELDIRLRINYRA